jgi:hypothetical protein
LEYSLCCVVEHNRALRGWKEATKHTVRKIYMDTLYSQKYGLDAEKKLSPANEKKSYVVSMEKFEMGIV